MSGVSTGAELEKIWKKEKKPRYNRDGKLRKPRSGWGPYRSVTAERKVIFGLERDVQYLQQEVRNLTALRDILQTKRLLQRHTPEGSLLRLVKEYFRVFRGGAVLYGSGRKGVLEDKDQRDFMHSIVDEEVDVGNGLKGPDAVMYQLVMYSTFIRFIRLAMHSYDIVVTEDSVVIKTNATLRFQVLRQTIEGIFPHVVGQEWLIAQLVGQEVEPDIGITFFFNQEGKCCKMDVEMDFVGAFTSIVKDPEVVNFLLKRALIADNCQLGVLDDPIEPGEELISPEAVVVHTASRNQIESQSEAGHFETMLSSEWAPWGRLRGDHAPAYCLELFHHYVAAFANGYHDQDEFSRTQGDFLRRYFVPDPTLKDFIRPEDVVERWRNLSECFAVLGFHQTDAASVEYASQSDKWIARFSARYLLRITTSTMELVFPHLISRLTLRGILIGKVIAVPSDIKVYVDSDTGWICCLVERMDFATALAKLVLNKQELSVVLSQARIAVDGVKCRKEGTCQRLARQNRKCGAR